MNTWLCLPNRSCLRIRAAAHQSSSDLATEVFKSCLRLHARQLLFARCLPYDRAMDSLHEDQSDENASATSDAQRPSPPQPPPANTASRKSYAASIECKDGQLPSEFATKVLLLEKLIGRKVFLLVEGSSPYAAMFMPTFFRLKRNKSQLPDEPIAVLLDSFGGQASVAFRYATTFRRHCGKYDVIIPRIAKSAATLFALGAESIWLGEDAELGPLDAQFQDHDVEEDWVSALDMVQAVEQLEDSAIEVAIKMLRHLNVRTKKKYNVLMEHALHFAAEITQPLFNKIDAVRYSRQHRILKEAQDYAERLLQPRFSTKEAKAIALDLVRKYPTHNFIISPEEARHIGVVSEGDDDEERREVGLQLAEEFPEGVNELLEWFSMNIHRVWALGFVVERQESGVSS
jgi:hypothetical protein